jgi:adhesin/invasin
MDMLRSGWRGAAVVALVAACGGGDGGTNPPGGGGSIAVQSGNNAVAAAGSAVVLEVIVRDTANNPLSGVPVTWAVGTGGGSVSAASTTSNASGIASVTRTLGSNAGAQTTTAARTGFTGSPITFTTIAQIQGATQMALSAGNGQTDTVLATLGTPYSVLVRDQNNAPVAGVTVNWSATAGSVPATSVTNASGIASATHTLGATAGSQGVTATVTGLQGSPVNFSSTATAGNAAVLSKTSGDGGSANTGTNVTYTVTVRDAQNNPKFGVTIDWAVTGGGGSITPPSNTTNASGQASATRTLSGTAGAHTATATASVIPSTVTFTTTAITGPAATVTVGNNFFNPQSVTINVGQSVQWNWGTGPTNPHNITWNTAGAPSNEPNRTSGSVTRTFTNTGTFQYECTNHVAMTGSVTVN